MGDDASVTFAVYCLDIAFCSAFVKLCFYSLNRLHYSSLAHRMRRTDALLLLETLFKSLLQDFAKDHMLKKAPFSKTDAFTSPLIEYFNAKP